MQQPNTSQTIKVQIKSVYGNELIYPVCDNAKTFASLVRQSTLTRHDINHIKKLGYAVEQIHALAKL